MNITLRLNDENSILYYVGNEVLKKFKSTITDNAMLVGCMIAVTAFGAEYVFKIVYEPQNAGQHREAKICLPVSSLCLSMGMQSSAGMGEYIQNESEAYIEGYLK